MAITVPTVLKQVMKPSLWKGERRRGSTLRDHPRLVDFTIYHARSPCTRTPRGAGPSWLWASRGSEAVGGGRRTAESCRIRADRVCGAARKGLRQSLSPSGLKVSGRTEGKRGDSFHIWPFRHSCHREMGLPSPPLNPGSGLLATGAVRQSPSRVRLFVTPQTAAHQASLSIITSRSLLRFTSIQSVMPSNQLILCHPLLLRPSSFPSMSLFSNELVLCIQWPKY